MKTFKLALLAIALFSMINLAVSDEFKEEKYTDVIKFTAACVAESGLSGSDRAKVPDLRHCNRHKLDKYKCCRSKTRLTKDVDWKNACFISKADQVEALKKNTPDTDLLKYECSSFILKVTSFIVFLSFFM